MPDFQEPTERRSGADAAAIVTGASSGMGLGIARALVEDGLSVALAARRPDRLERVAAELGPRALPIPTDVTSAQQVEQLVARTVDTFGRLDLLVACAGTYFQAPVEQTDERDWEQTIDVNLTGTFLMARAALPHLRAAAGRLIAISSTSGVSGEAGLSAYAASKWGVRGLVATILQEACSDGVRTTAICPGFTATPMAGYTEPQPHLIAIEDIVETVRWLLRLRPVVEVREVVLDRLSL